MSHPPSWASGRWVLGLCAVAALVSFETQAAAIDERPPPSPYVILDIGLAGPPPLDAASICVPSEGVTVENTLTQLEREGPAAALVGLNALADEAREHDEALASDVEVLRAGLAARYDTPVDSVADALRAAATSADTPRAQACAWLELARVQLANGRLAEARTDVRRALRAYADERPPAAIRRAAAHYRAESLYRSGQLDAAQKIYEELAKGGTPVARAARLRLADLEYVAEPTAARRAGIEAMLGSGDEAVSSSSAWSARIAEWALAEGDFAAALTWLERAPSGLSSKEQLAVSIRHADTLYLVGRPDEGEDELRGLADDAATEPLRQLAKVRLIDLERPSGEQSIAHLRRASRSELRGLKLYARSILADHLSAAGEDEAALDALVRIAYESAPSEIEQSLPNRIDQVLASLAKKHDCVGLLAAIGGRRTLLVKHAARPEPFLQLGDCYLELGMPRAARDIFRGATRRFGPELAKQITLRSASADLAIGEIDTARAAARSNLQLITVPVGEWRLLYGEILIGDAKQGTAIPVLMPLARDVAKGSLKGPDARRALDLLAGAATEHGSTPELRAQLHAALVTLLEDPEPDASLGTTLLMVADLHRLAGEAGEARDLYGRALTILPPGPIHSLAAYWRGLLAEDVDEARAYWSEVAEQDDTWALMARNELRLSRTRASLGRSEMIPKRLVADSSEGSP